MTCSTATDVRQRYLAGLRSSMSHMDARTLNEYRSNASFIYGCASASGPQTLERHRGGKEAHARQSAGHGPAEIERIELEVFTIFS
jgi:hypothetical protein